MNANIETHHRAGDSEPVRITREIPLAWLEAPPQIVRGQRVIEVDYAPGVVAQLREHAGPMRDMRPAEIEACDALIASIALEPKP